MKKRHIDKISVQYKVVYLIITNEYKLQIIIKNENKSWKRIYSFEYEKR